MSDNSEEHTNTHDKIMREFFYPSMPELEPDDVIIDSICYNVERDKKFTIPDPLPEKVSFWINGYTLGESDPYVCLGPRMRKFVRSFDSKKQDHEYILAWSSEAGADLNKDKEPNMVIHGVINTLEKTISITGRGFASIEVEMHIWGKKPESV